MKDKLTQGFIDLINWHNLMSKINDEDLLKIIRWQLKKK